MKNFLVFFVALYFLGCSTPDNSPATTSVSKTLTGVVQQDALHNTKIIAFPEVTDLPVPYGISVIQRPNLPDMYVVYMKVGSIEEARAENGDKLPVIQLNADNSSAKISDFVGIQISLAFLEKNRNRNPQIKVVGKNGSFMIFLPDYYIDGVLQYMRQS